MREVALERTLKTAVCGKEEPQSLWWEQSDGN